MASTTTTTTTTAPSPRLFILPKSASQHASIITLAHPRSSFPTRYYFCPEAGIFEFTRIAAPKSLHRSWLLSAKKAGATEVARARTDGGAGTEGDVTGEDEMYNNGWSGGYVVRKAEVFAATRMDPLFLLLPGLSPRHAAKEGSSKEPFLAFDDHLERLAESSRHLNYALKHEPIRERIRDRMASVCDVVQAGDEQMYRLSEGKLLQELCQKARRMVVAGLPQSMDERFVRKALEVPVVGLKRERTVVSEPSGEDEAVRDEISVDASDSQTSTGTASTPDTRSSDHTTITIPETLDATAIAAETPAEVLGLLRLRVAVTYLVSTYVPAHLATALTHLLDSHTSPIDFGACTRQLAHVAELRAEALASRSVGDFSWKRGMAEDEGGAESRAAKKRKQEEEERRRKAGQSRGVRDLQKVDTSGMRKMSDFFGKRERRPRGGNAEIR
ncbi:hypothetical protein MMC26_006295 [Xylographa opegraphella]|nr:hypothetical protein [Xylographa opegraphella]